MGHFKAPWYIVNDEGLVRVKVVSAVGVEVAPGVFGADPDVAKPHLEKMGWCDEDATPDPNEPEYHNPKITLDDGAILWGYECWWTPILTPIGEERQAELDAADEAYNAFRTQILEKWDKKVKDG